MPTTTWNPNDKSDAITLTNGNLTAGLSTIRNSMVRATHGVYQSGKGYFELTVGSGSLDRWIGGVATIGETELGRSLSSWCYQAYYSSTKGFKYHSTYGTYGTPINNGGVFQCAVDSAGGKIWFGGDGVWFEGGNPETGDNPTYDDVFGPVYPAWGGYQLVNNTTARFALEAFSYAPPTGFSAWNDIAINITSTAVLGASARLVDLDGGALSVIEPVTRMNSPVSRRVRLCDQISGRVVREQWSDPVTGLVTFTDLREGPWILYALDHTGEFEAVAISDRVATVDGVRP
jgi:hypothetical protein